MMKWLANGRWIWLTAAVLVADQVTKKLVSQMLPLGGITVVIPGLFNLVHTDNRGVAFGILADAHSPWVASILIAFSLAVMSLLAWLLVTDRIPGQIGQIGAALILGGAAGNVFDRLVHHSVVDFLDFHLHGYHWPAFNVADSAIVIGGGLIVLSLLGEQHETATGKV